jgi:hypothetical protein
VLGDYAGTLLCAYESIEKRQRFEIAHCWAQIRCGRVGGASAGEGALELTAEVLTFWRIRGG